MYLLSCAKGVRLCKRSATVWSRKESPLHGGACAPTGKCNAFPMGSIFPVTSTGLPKVWELW